MLLVRVLFKKQNFPFYSIDKEKICMYSFVTYQFDSLASVAQSAERNHGKVEVSGSIPLGGFSFIGSPAGIFV